MGKRRTADEMIKDLETRIAGIKARAERKKARRDPAVSQALAAIKAIDRSLAAGPNGTMKGALQEARGTLSACVAVGGIVVPESTVGAPGKPRGRRRKVAAG
jgi:hypothetical protein